MFRPLIMIVAISAATLPLFAINGYLGLSGGYGATTSATATAGGESASVGFQPGPGVGGFVGGDLTNVIGGEVRYLLLFDNLRVSQGGTDATLSARSHLLHYDFLLHARPRNSTVRPFLAGGGGIRWIEGTGAQQVYQALSQFALLTPTREVVPLISIGGGLKFRISPWISLRTEIRDYISPHLTKVIAAPPGASVHGWIHEIVGQAALTITFH
jgi:hypothetical protein